MKTPNPNRTVNEKLTHVDNPVSSELDKLLDGFEHEYDVTTEKLEITKPVFDGRLGNPSLTLKLNLTRYIKHHAEALIASEVKSELQKFVSLDYGIKKPTIQLIEDRIGELEELSKNNPDV